ncbi:MAG: PEP-CTERM sorting domain-containing protein [Opitutaceae bacterium]|jgi:hypothetical protein
MHFPSLLRPFAPVLLALCLACPAARGQTLISDVGTGTPDDTVYGIYGLVFYSTIDITVRSVGFYDLGGDGLVDAHRVGFGSGSGGDIWPFAEATIPDGTTAALVDGFRWINLSTPIELVANTYYTVAGEMLFGSDPMLTNNSSDYTLADYVGVSAGRYNYGITWTDGSPSTNNPSTQTLTGIFVAVNFSTESLGSNTVPEPSTYAAFAGVAALLFCGWRRRRIR